MGKAAAVCAGVKQHTDDQVQQAAAPTQDEATYTDAERMYAICMATHARAGATSPARLLCPELFQHVATFLDEWKVRGSRSYRLSEACVRSVSSTLRLLCGTTYSTIPY